MSERRDSESWAGAVMLVVLVAARGADRWHLPGPRDEGTRTVTVSAGTQSIAQKVDPHVVARAHDIVNFACAQCHGLDGEGGVSRSVPALKKTGLTASRLPIIDHGLGESANPTHPFMPVWGQVISSRQVDDLVAYIRAGLPAVRTATPIVVPTGQGAAVQGQALYSLYGCINCHGPNGLGGVPNPSSPDKTIPPLSGAAFRKQFNTGAKIIAVIKSGSIIGQAPIVSMPHWGGIIPPDRLHALAAYIETLKSK